MLVQKQLVFLINSPFTETPGGRENWIANIAPHLQDKGYKITVICRRSNRQPLFYTSSDINFVRFNDLRSSFEPDRVFMSWAKRTLGLLLVLDMIVFVLRGYQVVKTYLEDAQEEIYLIAMGTITEGLIAYYIRWRLQYHRVVVSVRGKAPWEIGKPLPYLRPIADLIEKKILRSIAYIWANGYDTKEYIKDQGGDAIVVPNGVDYNGYCEPVETTSRLSINNEDGSRPVIVMSIAALRAEKGIPQVVAAIPRIKGFTQQLYKMVFVGAGDPTRFLNALDADGCAECAEFTGPIPSIEICHEADIMICVSGGSGMSMSAIEAMAAGKAIVAWDTPVYQQLLVNGYSAFLVPYNDIVALARAIAILVENPRVRSYFGANAQREAKKYDWAVVGSTIDRAIQAIV
jgi:glycosyltransferase involved in cell wall biosynthesis